MRQGHLLHKGLFRMPRLGAPLIREFVSRIAGNFCEGKTNIMSYEARKEVR